MLKYHTLQLLSGRVSAFYAKGPRFNPGLGIHFVCLLSHAAELTLQYFISAVCDALTNWC